MTNVWCVPANGGEFTEHFLRGDNAGIGWREIVQDLGLLAEVLDDPYQVSLAALRDTLLLKLVSSEIHLRDVTELVKAEV